MPYCLIDFKFIHLPDDRFVITGNFDDNLEEGYSVFKSQTNHVKRFVYFAFLCRKWDLNINISLQTL